MIKIFKQWLCYRKIRRAFKGQGTVSMVKGSISIEIV
jgi:hypothetical protein